MQTKMPLKVFVEGAVLELSMLPLEVCSFYNVLFLV